MRHVIINHKQKGKLDGRGTTGSCPCCKSWKQWSTPVESQSIGKEPCGTEGTIVDAL